MSVSTLCQNCGLCCDGTLFTSVPLKPTEVEPVRRLSLPVISRADGSPGMAQRCAALQGRCCTVYSERPEACRRYHCHLFTALSEGEVSLEESLRVVGEAHARLRAAGDDPAAREQAEAYLDRHFRGRQRRG